MTPTSKYRLFDSALRLFNKVRIRIQHETTTSAAEGIRIEHRDFPGMPFHWKNGRITPDPGEDVLKQIAIDINELNAVDTETERAVNKPVQPDSLDPTKAPPTNPVAQTGPQLFPWILALLLAAGVLAASYVLIRKRTSNIGK